MEDKYHIVMVNRGKNYWDNESYKVVENCENISMCWVDRRSDTFVESVTLAILENDLPLKYVVDFSCFKPQDCHSILKVIDQVKAAGKQAEKLKYVFISTDSTYDASAFLID